LLVEAATGCDESEKGANRIGTVDRRVVEIELEKETGSDRIGLPTSCFKHMQVSEKVQGIEHVHEDLEHRLLEIEMRVEQEVSERLASNEQQLADCLEQVQHLERLCTKMVDALNSFRPTRDEATDHNHMAVVFAPRQVSQLVHPVRYMVVKVKLETSPEDFLGNNLLMTLHARTMKQSTTDFLHGL